MNQPGIPTTSGSARQLDDLSLVTTSVWHRPVLSETDKDQRAKRRAQAAVALLHLRQPERVWPLFGQDPDPRLRTFLLHRLAGQAIEPRTLLDRLEAEPDAVVRSALILALGEYTAEQLPEELRQQAAPTLFARYREEADPGVHSAVEWLLRGWGQEARLKPIAQELKSGKVAGLRRWYVNGQGQTFAVVTGPVQFDMGEEPTHRCRIPRSFAIATKEVSNEQFQRFRKEHRAYSSTGDGPATGVSWYDAVAYCNWLSEQEGIGRGQQCYVPWFGERMAPAPDYLGRTGYRLPTEAEWEFACRAGSKTGWASGGTEELLEKHGWYVRNAQFKRHPVGLLKPNVCGLFDMHGNAWEWSQDRYRNPPEGSNEKPAVDVEDPGDSVGLAASRLVAGGLGERGPLAVVGILGAETFGEQQEGRVVLGGAFYNEGPLLRSANRYWIRPGFRDNDGGYGLRPARTYR